MGNDYWKFISVLIAADASSEINHYGDPKNSSCTVTNGS